MTSPRSSEALSTSEQRVVDSAIPTSQCRRVGAARSMATLGCAGVQRLRFQEMLIENFRKTLTREDVQ